ncbi:MAG: hypothetical protein CM1200mP9_00270 [Gammaproteobacteria bacterium]|nr:MAG: hypothetical protein CM1200mP9_00270 [Gammaproteobacteria bacterium]
MGSTNRASILADFVSIAEQFGWRVFYQSKRVKISPRAHPSFYPNNVAQRLLRRSQASPPIPPARLNFGQTFPHGRLRCFQRGDMASTPRKAPSPPSNPMSFFISRLRSSTPAPVNAERLTS